MFTRKSSLTFFLLPVATIAAIAVGVFTVVRADSPDWFAPVTPMVSKVTELPANTTPFTTNFDCDIVEVNSITTCSSLSSIGTVLTNGKLKVGDSLFALSGYNGFGTIIPVPNSPMFMSPQPGATTGNYIAVHRSLERSDLRQVLTGSGTAVRKQYQVTKSYDLWITDDNGQKLQINTTTMAFSSNGYWMVFDVPRVGLFRMNTTTFDLVPFGVSAEPNWYSGIYPQPITISDDGNFASMVTADGGLMLYDISGCSQHGYVTGKALTFAGCRGRDIWRGQFALTSKTDDRGVMSAIPNGYVLGNLRFVDDGNIRFDARYDYVSNSNYQVARYVVTASGASLHKLGLLGMGDSYISGEGEFDYIDGTDELGLNMCHLSKLSYPYLLGSAYFDSSESVACSGAITDDIRNDGDPYNGQFDTRNKAPSSKDQILSLFSPGYLYQNAFAKTYQPQAIVLSIGGNNVGFAKIVESCVRGFADGQTCYASYEDRKELLDTINGSFDELVKTYQAILDASPGTRVYVVGYPQIAKPDGDCGANVHLNQAETEFAAQLISHLDNVVKQAAANAGVVYVDTEHAFDGHRLCEASGVSVAMNGLTAGKDGPDEILGVALSKYFRFLGKESYHPTVLGHQLLETAIANQTNDLHKPMPSAQPNVKQPITDSNDPMLVNAPISDRQIYQLEMDDDITDDVLNKNVAISVNVSGLMHETLLSSLFKAVLHSDPVDLGTLSADANGDIHGTITIPETVPAGLHTLHLYGKNAGGQDIDIEKFVYVTSDEPISGYCGVVPDSGQDIDQDGIDDACDPVIGPASAAPDETQPGNDDTPDTAQTGDTDRNQPADAQNQPTEISQEQNTEASELQAATSISQTELNTNQEVGVADEQPASDNDRVLGTATVKPITSRAVERHNYIWLWMLLILSLFAGSFMLVRRSRANR